MANNRIKLPKILWGARAAVATPTGFAAAGNGVGASGAWAVGTYYFAVTAIVGGVESPVSNESGTFISVANDSITMSWVPVADATAYRIYLGLSGPGTLTKFRTVGAVASYTDTGSPASYNNATPTSLTANGNGSTGSGAWAAGDYKFYVTAVVGGVETAPSNEAGTLITVLNDSITMNWTGVSGATAYRVYLALAGAGSEDRYRALGAVVTLTDTGSAAGYTLGLAPVSTTLNVGYLLDNLKAGPQPRAGSSTDQAPSGREDAWTVGRDYVLEAELTWIPQTDSAVPLATGWDGPTGVAAWLSWARDKNLFRFYPDASAAAYILAYLAEPMQGYAEPEPNGQRRLRITLRNALTAFDGY